VARLEGRFAELTGMAAVQIAIITDGIASAPELIWMSSQSRKHTLRCR